VVTPHQSNGYFASIPTPGCCGIVSLLFRRHNPHALPGATITSGGVEGALGGDFGGGGGVGLGYSGGGVG